VESTRCTPIRLPPNGRPAAPGEVHPPGTTSSARAPAPTGGTRHGGAPSGWTPPTPTFVPRHHNFQQIRRSTGTGRPLNHFIEPMINQWTGCGPTQPCNKPASCSHTLQRTAYYRPPRSVHFDQPNQGNVVHLGNLTMPPLRLSRTGRVSPSVCGREAACCYAQRAKTDFLPS